MRETIFALVGVTVAAAFAEQMCPKGEKSGVARYLRLLCALCVLTLILSPLLQLIKGANGADFEAIFESETAKEEYETIFAATVNKESAALLRAGVAKLLAEQFSAHEEDFTVQPAFGEGGELTRISVFLSGGALLVNPREAESYLRELFSCEVEVR